MHLLEAGVEVNVIREWLGHADLTLKQAQDRGRWASEARTARYYRSLSVEAGWPVLV
jgi:hypothetical protein